MAEVRLGRRAAKDLDSLSKQAARRVIVAIERLASDPSTSALDVKALVGRRPWKRLRVGDHRVLFRLYEGKGVLLVGRVIDRKELEKAVQSLPD